MILGRNANSQLLLIRAIDCKLKVYCCSTGINMHIVCSLLYYFHTSGGNEYKTGE